jgi:hypothetical protein
MGKNASFFVKKSKRKSLPVLNDDWTISLGMHWFRACERPKSGDSPIGFEKPDWRVRFKAKDLSLADRMAVLPSVQRKKRRLVKLESRKEAKREQARADSNAAFARELCKKMPFPNRPRCRVARRRCGRNLLSKEMKSSHSGPSKSPVKAFLGMKKKLVGNHERKRRLFFREKLVRWVSRKKISGSFKTRLRFSIWACSKFLYFFTRNKGWKSCLVGISRRKRVKTRNRRVALRKQNAAQKRKVLVRNPQSVSSAVESHPKSRTTVEIRTFGPPEGFSSKPRQASPGVETPVIPEVEPSSSNVDPYADRMDECEICGDYRKVRLRNKWYYCYECLRK